MMIVMFDSLVIFTGYHMLQAHSAFGTYMLPCIPYSTVLFLIMFYTLVRGKSKKMELYKMNDPKLYKISFERIMSKLVILGVFGLLTLIF